MNHLYNSSSTNLTIGITEGDSGFLSRSQSLIHHSTVPQLKSTFSCPWDVKFKTDQLGTDFSEPTATIITLKQFKIKYSALDWS